mgnify:CR=1 FL=1
MDLTEIAAMSSYMSQANTLQSVGYAMMDMSMNTDKIQGAEMVNMINSAPAPSLDPNVGINFNASI